MALGDLGWDESWHEALASAAHPSVEGKRASSAAGRVARVDKGLCTVITETGPVRATLGAEVLDAMAADTTAGPATGDWCLLRHWPDGPVTIDTLAPRRTVLVRADAANTSRGQVLAANADIVGVVVALHPEPNLGRIERLLTIAWESGARPVVVLTKTDLVVDGDAIAEEVRAAAPGVVVVCCSATTGQGTDELRSMLTTGATVVLVGASGHGKSTLTNTLVGADVLGTASIREDGKGHHTSVRRELLLVPGGGVVIDTPGLRGVGLQRDGGSLAAAFPDVELLTQSCRFRDCSHAAEPGCAVLAAVADGSLSVRRWESWRRLRGELVRAQTRTSFRLRAEERRRRQHRTFRT